MKIEFLGAVDNEVTGSSFLITSSDGKQILIDFGMFQGNAKIAGKNHNPLLFYPPALEAVLLTHAHLDHSGRLPLLVYGGYFGNVYMTKPTRELVSLILYDSAGIAQKESVTPIYTADEVRKLLSLIKTVEYGREIETPGFKVVFYDAGHILGSSSILITDKSSGIKLAISGDLGNTPQNLVKPTQYINAADYIIMESTYGDSIHPDEDVSAIIKEEISSLGNNGILLIPAFALERTQELLHIIHHLKNDNKISKDIPVYLDSPLSIDATSVYLKYTDYLNSEIVNHYNLPFNFNNLIISFNPKESRSILESKNPKIIIAGSGMVTGGRIMHHIYNYIGDKTTRILFVGYQAEETLGRKILSGAQNIVIDSKDIHVRAHIREIKALSSHADQPKLIKWLKNISGVKKVFLVHGEENQRKVLAEKIITDLKIKDVILPGFEDYDLT